MNNQSFDLDTPIMEFRDGHGIHKWTLRNACSGTLVTGSTGAGKSSSVGKMLALKFLKMGMGGLVLCAKNDEKDTWLEYARQAGRLDDVIVVEPGGRYHFDFLEYESLKKFGGKAITDNVVDVLKTVLNASEVKDSGGNSEDHFFKKTQDLLLNHTASLAQLAYGKINIKQLYTITTTIPQPGVKVSENPKPNTFAHAFKVAMDNIQKQVEAHKAGLSSDALQRFNESPDQDQIICDALPDYALILSLDDFFNDYYKSLSPKTRSIVDLTFIAFLYHLQREPVYSMLCRHSNFSPEDCYLKGSIIILNIPVKTYFKIGQMAQTLFKVVWQRAMEGRNIEKNNRPVFCWQDEYQLFTHDLDSDFQSTARSSRVCCVALTQNIPALYASMGGEKAIYRVKGLLGNLATRFYMCNADTDTNTWASESIGDGYVPDPSVSHNIAGEISMGRTMSLKLERRVRPEKFMSLKIGGKDNDYQCEAYVQWQGKTFADGATYTKATFSQNYKP